MQTAQSEKSAPLVVDFPEGLWNIYCQSDEANGPYSCGHLNLVRSINSPQRFVGAILFDDADFLNNIAGKSFPVNIMSFDNQTGDIQFQILGATTLYAPTTPVPFQFFFQGKLELDGDKLVLKGEGKVPGGFYPEGPGPMEEGMTVTWTSKGSTDPGHKTAR